MVTRVKIGKSSIIRESREEQIKYNGQTGLILIRPYSNRLEVSGVVT